MSPCAWPAARRAAHVRAKGRPALDPAHDEPIPCRCKACAESDPIDRRHCAGRGRICSAACGAAARGCAYCNRAIPPQKTSKDQKPSQGIPCVAMPETPSNADPRAEKSGSGSAQQILTA